MCTVKSASQSHPPSPTMPRTSNLFITSPRMRSPPAGEMCCSNFSEETPALTSGWWSELQTPGETLQPSYCVSSSLSFHYILSLPPASLKIYQVVYFSSFIYGTDAVFLFSIVPVFHVFMSALYFYPKLLGGSSERQDKQRSIRICCQRRQIWLPVCDPMLHVFLVWSFNQSIN